MVKKIRYTQEQKKKVQSLTKDGYTAKQIEGMTQVNQKSQHYIKVDKKYNYTEYRQAIINEIIDTKLNQEQKSRIVELFQSLNQNQDLTKEFNLIRKEYTQSKKMIRKLVLEQFESNNFASLIPQNKKESKKRRVLVYIIESVISKISKQSIQNLHKTFPTKQRKQTTIPNNHFQPSPETNYCCINLAAQNNIGSDMEQYALGSVQFQTSLPQTQELDQQKKQCDNDSYFYPDCYHASQNSYEYWKQQETINEKTLE